MFYAPESLSRWILVLALPLITQTAQATTAASDPSSRPEIMVVTASRSPQPLADTTMRTQVVDGYDIERLQSRDLAEALRLVPGLQLREIHGKTGQEVQLQGFNGDRVLVLVDGKPVSATTGSTVDVSQLSATNVASIEVVPGAASSLYGSAAMGGVVNIITRQEPHQLRLMSELGRYPEMEISDAAAPQRHYLLSASQQWQHWTADASIDQRRTSEIDLNTDTFASNGFGGSKTNSQFSLTRATGADSSASLSLQHYQEDLSQRLSERQRHRIMKDEDLVRRRAVLDLQQTNDIGRWGLSLLAEQQQDATRQYNADPAIQAGGLDRTAHYRQQKLTAEWTPADGAIQLSGLPDSPELALVAGVELFREDMTQQKSQIYLTGYQPNPDETVTDIGSGLLRVDVDEVAGARRNTDLFSQATVGWQQGEYEQDLSIGVRWQHDSDFGSHLAPTISARQSWPLADSWSLQTRQSLGAGYRVSNLKERFYLFDHSIYGYLVEGNPDLTPEQSRSAQLSLTLSNQSDLHVELSAFHNRIRDLIETIDTGETDNSSGMPVVIYRYGNIEQALTRGLELSTQWRLHPQLQQRLSFTLLDARNTSSDTPLQNRARHHAKLAWLWDPVDWLAINLMGEYEGGLTSSVDTGNNTIKSSPDYWRWDLTLRATSWIGGYEQGWFTGIKNLTHTVRQPDDSYDRRPTEGRYIYLGTDLRF